MYYCCAYRGDMKMLPQEKEFLELKGELEALKAENTACKEMNYRLLVLVEELNRKIDAISAESSENRSRTDAIIAETVSELKNMSSELEELTGYVENMWSATKAIWIDSLLSDVEKTIGEQTSLKSVKKPNNKSKQADNAATSGFDADFYWTKYYHELY